MSVVHFHYSIFENRGDTRRVKNIDKAVASKLSNSIIEVELFGIGLYKKVKELPAFKLSDKVIKKYYVPFLNRPFIGDWISSFIIGYICHKYKAEYVIGEFSTCSKSLKLLHFFSPSTQIIIDVHGAVPEETEYIYPKYPKWKIDRLTNLEKKSVSIANYVICQSNEMKRHLISKYNADSAKIAVFKCGVDVNLFRVDNNLRSHKRYELGITDDEIAMIYSGAIQKWQKIEDTLFIFKSFHDAYPKSKLIILTPEGHLLNELIIQCKMDSYKEYIISRESPFFEVPEYLNAADVAFLIRDNVILNAVASPTKLAEYLACGLPIITTEVANKWITPEITKYFVFSDLSNNLNKDILNIINKADKYEISKYAKEYLSVQTDEYNINRLLNK